MMGILYEMEVVQTELCHFSVYTTKLTSFTFTATKQCDC